MMMLRSTVLKCRFQIGNKKDHKLTVMTGSLFTVKTNPFTSSHSTEFSFSGCQLSGAEAKGHNSRDEEFQNINTSVSVHVHMP